MAQAAEQQAPGAHAAEALQRRWETLERSTNAETQKIRARHRAQDKQLADDPDITEVARQQRREQLKDETRQVMISTRLGYERDLRELELHAERAAFGKAPKQAGDLAAWRDSVDRARQARPDRAGALRAMRHAVRSGDRGLADEIARQAANNGWGDVLDVWGQDGGPVAITGFLRDIRGAINDPGRHMFRWVS